MKTLLLIVLLFTFSSTIIAQNSFGVRLAYNNSNVSKAPGNYRVGSLSRFQAGVFAKHYIHNNWYAKANIMYDQKGNTYDDDYAIADAGKKVTIKLNYASVSVDAGYSFRFKAKQAIHIDAGPYLAYGINGTEKGVEESLMGPVYIHRRIDFIRGEPKYGTNTEIKQLDAGLNFNVEYQFRNYGLFINYGLGLTSREEMRKSMNRVISVGLSYSLGCKKMGKGCFKG